jgi:ribosome assembly protein 1
VDPKIPIKAIFSQWLPLEHAIFQMVINHTPDPSQMSSNKIQDLVSAMKPENSASYPKETQVLMNDLKSCDSQSDNVIVFISKMFPIPFKFLEMCDKTIKNEDNEFEPDDEVLMGFARIFSGVLKSDSEVYVLNSKYNPRNVSSGSVESHMTKVKISNIYVLMGKNLEPIEEAHAGNVVAIGGLHKYVIKTATLTNNLYCPTFNDLPILATPILRVAIEPKNTQEMPILVKGLKLLNQVDPCCQVLIQDTGEHVLLTLGEVHLEKCITDLKDSFAKIEINVSKPIVPFKETIVEFTNPIVQPDVLTAQPSAAEEEDKTITIQTSNKNCTVKVLAQPLPSSIVQVLEKNKDILKMFIDKNELLSNHNQEILKDIRGELEDTLKKEFNGAFNVQQVWSMGPKKNATCLLLNASGFQHSDFFAPTTTLGNDPRYNYENAFVNGFQAAVQTGPLCHEPMHAVCFIIQEWKIEDESQYDGSLSGKFSKFCVIYSCFEQSVFFFVGQIITAVKEGCKRSFQVQPQRLVAPMYNCNIIVNSNVLGKFLTKKNSCVIYSANTVI